MKRKQITWNEYMEIAERDNYTCQVCGKEGKFEKFSVPGNYTRIGIFHDGKRFEVDHIVPVSKGGEHTMENMRLSCIRCNRSKGNK